MGKEKHDEEMVYCPVGKFFMDLEKACRQKPKFVEHLTRSRIEFLRAIRSLVDEKIDRLEKKAAPKAEKKATKIKVE